jgi:hypothetical protein
MWMRRVVEKLRKLAAEKGQNCQNGKPTKFGEWNPVVKGMDVDLEWVDLSEYANKKKDLEKWE